MWNAIADLFFEYAQGIISTGVTAGLAYLKRRYDLKKIAKDKTASDQLSK